MPQIAQQDYIRIPIANRNNPTEAEKAELKKVLGNGTLLDSVLVFTEPTKGEARVSGWSFDGADTYIDFVFDGDFGSIML